MFQTSVRSTWCPGCSNFAIEGSFDLALKDLVESCNIKKEQITIVTGIGCHGKMFDYLDLNGFYSLHGRSLPMMEGIKKANPELLVVGFAGDGDTFDEGMEHFVHSCKRDSDLTLFVHTNQLFALTTGQADSITPMGKKTKTTPEGKKENAIDPLVLALASGASFVAQAYAKDVMRTKEIMKSALMHKGFSFVNILQPCVSFNDFTKEIESIKSDVIVTSNLQEAMATAMDKSKYHIGVIYQK